MRQAVAIFVLSACLGGCAITSPQTHDAIAATGEQGTAIDCSGDADCKLKWDRAQFWLARHSAWKVQTATDVMIQTFNPVGDEPSYGFNVTREPGGGGNYTIGVQIMCGNIFGCGSDPMDVVKAFCYYVRTGTDVLQTAGRVGGIR